MNGFHFISLQWYSPLYKQPLYLFEITTQIDAIDYDANGHLINHALQVHAPLGCDPATSSRGSLYLTYELLCELL